jgi:hypothetical protein
VLTNRKWTKEQNEKRSKTMKRLFALGKINSHLKGRIPWDKGLTKDIDDRLRKQSEKMKSKVPWNKGKRGLQVSWRKGLTKETDERIRKHSENFVPWNKGLTSKTDIRIKRSAEKRKGVIPWNKDKKTGLIPKTAFKKGFIPWNKNRKGMFTPWNKGLTSKVDNRILTGKKHPMYGRHHTEETIAKIRRANSGERSFFWRGGTGEFYFRGNEWNRIRVKVWERDSFTCQKCGKINCKLYAHHIVPFVMSKDNSLKNLITLCCRCHMIEEYYLKRKYFGKNMVSWDDIPIELQKEHERIQKAIETIEERHKEYVELEKRALGNK